MSAIISYRFFILVLMILLSAYGVYSFLRLPVDTFPDPTPVQVVVYTETPGLSAEETEVLVTRPIESSLSGIRDAQLVRSISLPGLSYVTVFFKDGTDVYQARNLVSQKLSEVQGKLPSGYTPRMGPNTSGLGNVLFYALVDQKGNYTLEDLKTLQIWKVKPMLTSVDGVEDISQWGPEKAYRVSLDPEKMLLLGVTFEDVIKALEEYNQTAGGGFTTGPEGDLVVRGIGRVRSLEDIKNIPVKKGEGYSITLGQVADVYPSELPNRRGAFTYNGQEVQGNIVLKRINVNTMELVEALKQRLKEVQSILPDGVKVDILYDQSYLTQKALQTIEKALLEGVLLVIGVVSLYLWNVRTAILIALSIPLTLTLSFILMEHANISGNLMSFGGLTIGIGLFADASVVVVENIFKHLSERPDKPKHTVILESLREVVRPVAFAVGIIVTVFLPIFSFESVEGKYYKPLALTIIFALISSLLVAFLFMPVLSFYLLKPGKEESLLFAKLRDAYLRLLNRAFAYRKYILVSVVFLFLSSLLLLSRIGTEFTPQLEEGALLVKSFLNPNVTLEEAKRVAKVVEETALKYPEVVRTFSNIGRAEVGEPEDVSYIETFIILKPAEEWKNFKSREEFEQILRKGLEGIPGVEFSFTQPIQMRIDELLSGVKSTLAVKVFGDDLKEINQIAYRVEEIIKGIKGAVDVETEAQSGKLQLRIVPDMEKLQRYDLTTADLMNLVSYALGGKEVGYLQEDSILFPIYLSLKDKDPKSIENLPLLLKDSSIVRLSDVARVEMAEGFLKIRRENGMRFALVQSDVSGRDLGSFVKEVQDKIAKEIKLPQGYFITFGGQFENQQRAMKKLAVVVPITVVLIFFLLLMNYRSVRDALIVMLNVPFATVGGVFALYLSGYNLSLPAAIGFIAVFGIATLNGVVLVSYIRSLVDEGMDVKEAVFLGALRRLRPILITASAASIGIVPMLLSKGVGSEMQKPLAVVVVGGIFTSTILTLIVLPLVYEKFGRSGNQQTYGKERS